MPVGKFGITRVPVPKLAKEKPQTNQNVKKASQKSQCRQGNSNLQIQFDPIDPQGLV
jgi:hypothetical protein